MVLVLNRFKQFVWVARFSIKLLLSAFRSVVGTVALLAIAYFALAHLSGARLWFPRSLTFALGYLIALFLLVAIFATIVHLREARKYALVKGMTLAEYARDRVLGIDERSEKRSG